MHSSKCRLLSKFQLQYLCNMKGQMGKVLQTNKIWHKHKSHSEIVFSMSAGEGEEGKENGSDKTDQDHTVESARSRAESLADTTEGMDDSRSKHESEDGMGFL